MFHPPDVSTPLAPSVIPADCTRAAYRQQAVLSRTEQLATTIRAEL